MKATDLKIEINKIMDKVPDEVLQEIYNLLKEFETKGADDVLFAHYLNKVVKEDKELLDRLAK